MRTLETIYEVYRDRRKITEYTSEAKAKGWIKHDERYNPIIRYHINETKAEKIYEHYNPHPRGKNVGDCVKRSFTKLLDKPYEEVSLELNRFKKVSKATKYNEPKNWHGLATQYKWVQHMLPVIKGQPRMRAHDFVRKHPLGKYLLKTRRHTIAVVDGIIYDTWDSRNEVVYHYWEVR